jgi:hypothetical protein
MKKLKLSTFFDGIFIFFLSFFVFYALLKGIVKSIILTTFLSILFSSSATFLFALISEKVLGKKDVELKDKNEKLLNEAHFVTSQRIRNRNSFLLHVLGRSNSVLTICKLAEK